MKYFFDTEFIENGCTIDLLSIGIVDEEGRSLYLQHKNAKFREAGDWVWRNVFPHLIHFDMSGMRSCDEGHTSIASIDHRVSPCGATCPWRSHAEIRDAIRAFLDQEKYGPPEIWGYYADYDWVAFCQLFGPMIYLPKGYPMYCRDLKQLLDERGNPTFQKESDAHHAMSDALWIRNTYLSLVKSL